MLKLFLALGVTVSYRAKTGGEILKRSFEKNRTLKRTDVRYHLSIVFEFLLLLFGLLLWLFLAL